MSILSYKDDRLKRLAGRSLPKGLPADLIPVLRRKLRMLEVAATLEDLRVPPANRLEALKGDRAGQYSIRVNDRFRPCFCWEDGVKDLEFVDYHKG